MQRTVIELLRSASKQFPNTPYLNEKDDNGWFSYTFEETFHQSELFAAALMKYGFEKDDRIALLAEGRNHWVIAEYGMLMLGCINIPLSIKLLPEEIFFRLQHAACKAMILSSNTLEKALPAIAKLDKSDFKIIYLDDNLSTHKRLLVENGIDEQMFITLNSLMETGNTAIYEAENSLRSIAADIKEDQVVTICYTSGTTGNPKGIMLTHLNYYANSTAAMQYFDVNQGDRLLIILPLDHSFAHTVGIYACAVKGLSIFFVDARGGSKNALKNIPINLKEANPHFLLTVPALSGNFMNKMTDGVKAKGGLIQKLFEAGLSAGIEMYGDGYSKGGSVAYHKRLIYKLADSLIFSKLRGIFGNSIRFCVGGGALLDISQQRFFAAIGVPVYQGYGLTEAAPIISANTPAKHKLGTSGAVIPNIECYIADDHDNVLPPGQKGEIVIRGENVMKGYYLNPEATEASIREGWLWTGDLGYFDQDGFLVVVGRQKALLIASNGEKYSPEGIEEAIVNVSPLISQVMVYNDMKPYTSAIVTLSEERILALKRESKIHDADELIDKIAHSLHSFKQHPSYKDAFPDIWVPKTFAIAPEQFTEQNLMINSTMKMVRHKVAECHKNLIDFMYTADGETPKNDYNRTTLKKMFKM